VRIDARVYHDYLVWSRLVVADLITERYAPVAVIDLEDTQC